MPRLPLALVPPEVEVALEVEAPVLDAFIVPVFPRVPVVV